MTINQALSMHGLITTNFSKANSIVLLSLPICININKKFANTEKQRSNGQFFLQAHLSIVLAFFNNGYYYWPNSNYQTIFFHFILSHLSYLHSSLLFLSSFMLPLSSIPSLHSMHSHTIRCFFSQNEIIISLCNFVQ